jgi:LCP family protein required for cell wall assembly
MGSVTSRPLTRRRPGPRHATHLRRRPLVRFAAVAGVGLLAFVLAGGAFAYSALQGNITTHDVTDLLGGSRPDPVDPSAGRPINLLFMGSDVRSGENAALGGAPETEGMRSDTTLLVHIAADRSRADIVSIPRDLLVDIPSCELPDGESSPPQPDTMFNAAFSTGGDQGQVEYAAACTIKTVEQMTGVFIDDFVVIDFAGFTRMVAALGGIPMCIPEPLTDRLAGLDLEAGQQTLNGHEALAYARARKEVGDGSDISRIGRQQLLLGAMIRQVLSKNLLTDLPALYEFLDAATESVTTGPTLGTIPNLVGLATSFRAVPAGGVSFVTVPFEWVGPRVRPTEVATLLWAAIEEDRPIAPEPEPTPTPAPDAEAPTDEPTSDTGSPTPTPTPTAPWDVITGEDTGGVCS